MGIHQAQLNHASSVDCISANNSCDINNPDSYTTSNNDELGDEITLLAGQINAANYLFLKLIAEFDRREAWGGFGIRSCAHWLNWKCGIALGAAREKVRVARCLELLPKINAAFSLGVLSYSKVRAMTRVANAGNEDFLLMIAEHGTASHIELLVRKYQSVERQNNPAQEHDHYAAREMVSYQDDDGMWIIRAKLPAEAGSLVVKAIDEILNQQHHELHEEPNKEPNKEKNVSAETLSTEMPEPSFAQKRADALAAMAEHYVASAANGDGVQTLAGSERCQVMLHVDINTLRAHSGCADSHSHLEHSNLENKHWISPQTAKRLSCDASVITVLEDDKGKVLNIGRRARTIPPSIQRALNVRDSTCRFPGCCEARYVDAHHIKHWADGGETRLDNLVMLCRHHHRELHRGSFQLQVSAAQLVFTKTCGDKIETCFSPQFPQLATVNDSNEKNSKTFLRKRWPLIDHTTGRSRWQGERMDMTMAVIGLKCGLPLTMKDPI